MTEHALKVFLVDDDPSARLISRFQLEDLQVGVREFADGASCLAAIGDAPDIVVLDVEMPGMDGISVCRAIRAEGIADAQIIFASSHDDLETRLAAYDAGGNDYIVKPYAPEELARKIGIASRAMQSARAVSASAQFAQQAAFTAMSSMAEMGVTQDFMRNSFNCQTADELGRAVCLALEQYGLQGLAELRDGANAHRYSSHGPCTELETSLLGHARGLERIFQFGDRLAINYPHATLFITNLPVADPDRVGRLRDHLAVLAEGAEVRFLVIIAEAKRIAQANSILGAVGELAGMLEQVEKNQEEHRAKALGIADDQLTALTRAFVHLGLTERQEETLIALAQEGIDRTAQLQDYSISMSGHLRDVIMRLKEMVAENA